jgi:hypothetical protein
MKLKTAVLFFVLLVPTRVWSQSILNFPRVFTPADLASTGFAVVNPGATGAAVTFTLYSAAGSAVASSPAQTVPAGGQLAKLGTELFPAANQAGWVQATSTAAGLQGFWIGGDFATFTDGADAAGTAVDVIFALVGANTEINIANPGTSTNNVTIRLLGTAGTDLAGPVTRSIPPAGVFKDQVSVLFPTANLASATHIRVTGSAPVTGTAVVNGYLVNPSWAVINAIDVTAFVAEANFPHVISGAGGGGNYTTVIGVTNLSSSNQTVTVTFTPEAGGASTSVQRTISANGSLRATAQELFNFPAGFQNGWVKVTGTAITGFAAYADSVAGGLAVVPVQATPRTQLLFAHIADLDPWYTGLALLNATSTPATVDVFAMTPSGALIGGADNVPTARFTLSPGTKTARLLLELIPQTQQRTSDGGFVFVRSTQPLYGIELFFTRSLSILSNVAAGAVAAGITYTPPAPSVSLSLTSVTPVRVARGATLTLNGSGFNSSISAVFSTVDGTVEAAPATATATVLTVTVPSTAISGPVFVRSGQQNSAVRIVEVSNATTLIQNPITVTTGLTTPNVDIYVSPPAAVLNAIEIGVFGVGETSFLYETASVDLPRGQQKELVVAGTGISAANGTTLTISGSGTTVSDVRYQPLGNSALIIVRVSVDANAAVGARNVVLTNSNFDTSVLTGGVLIR